MDDISSEGLQSGAQFVGYTPSALCHLLTRDHHITGIIRQVMMHHFSSADYIEQPILQDLIWKPGDNPGILIESQYHWTPEKTELRPGIYIRRNDQESTRRGVGADRLQAPIADKFGNPSYNTLWTGSHTLFCIAGTGQNAELLGTEVLRELVEFGPLVRKFCELLRFQVLQKSSMGMLEEAHENFVVPITVGYAYEERWVIRQQTPRLKFISLALLGEC